MKKKDTNRDEDHFFNARITVDNYEIKDVPCKLFLPERTNEKPYVLLRPNSESTEIIKKAHQGALSADICDFKGKIKTSINAPVIYFGTTRTRVWGWEKNLVETTVFADVEHLHITEFNAEKEDEENVKKGSEFIFKISANRLLTPRRNRDSSYTGEISYPKTNKVEFNIKDGVKLEFDKYFKTKDTKEGDVLQWSYLVAQTELELAANNVDEVKAQVLTEIDDFLLIASLAIRERTVCMGWDAYDNKRISNYFRGNYTFPKNSIEEDRGNWLIEEKHFESFMTKCYTQFLNYKNKETMRSAIIPIVPFNTSTVEVAFLNMFSGLESLILEFRKQENLEFILEGDEWLKMKKNIQKCIKNSADPILNKDQRSSMYNKLEELNRFSLKEAFNQFAKKMNIYLTDLWPLFGDSGGVGLVDIRNRLTHGDKLSSEILHELSIANEHLQYTLERALLRTLNWEPHYSNASDSYLKENRLSIQELPDARLSMSKYFNTNKS